MRLSLSLSLRCAACLLVLLCWSNTGQAQNTTDGSIYSRYGIGDLSFFGSSRAQAMGGGGVAMGSAREVNYANPASWYGQTLTRLSAGFQYQSVELKDASDATSRLSSGTLNAVQFSFPLLSNKLGLAFAFNPYSRVNYRVEAENVLTVPGEDDAPYRAINTGDGGLQQVMGGLGYRLTNQLSVGVSGHFLFGIIDEEQETTFDDATRFVPSNVRQSTRLYGFTATAGALLILPNIIRDRDILTVGATLTLPTHLKGDRVATIGDAQEPDTLGTPLNGSADLPIGVGIGVYYQPSEYLTFIADGRYEPWSSFESDLAFPGYTPNGASLFQDRLRISGGVEFLPAGSDIFASYFQRIAFRLGAYYDRAYVTPTANANLDVMALTGGLSLPSPFSSGMRLDINVEVGTRGSIDTVGLVQDRFLRLGLNINIGERWFNQQKLR